MFDKYQHAKSEDVDKALSEVYKDQSTEDKLNWLRMLAVFANKILKETEGNPELLKRLNPIWHETLEEMPKDVKMSLFFKKVAKHD